MRHAYMAEKRFYLQEDDPMSNYTTQMDAARKGIVTPQMETVAEKEKMPVED